MPFKWSLKTFKIKDLKDYHKNPRKLTEEQYTHLRNSLNKFGLIDKPIVNLDGTLIGGHQRKKVLEIDGVKEIECYVPDHELDPKEMEELNIRLNKNTGEWDWDILANQWEINDLLDWGFTEEELTIDIDEIEPSEPDNDVLEPPKDPKTKLGDVYELGEHRLVCGDSTNGDTVNLCLASHEPILMVTDPPYGVNYDPTWNDGGQKMREYRGKNKNTIAIGKVLNDETVNWALSWSLFPGSVVYVWHAPTKTYEVCKSLIDSELDIISNIIWVKQHFAISRGDYHWQHESCWYAVKKGYPHNWQGARDQATIWEISNLNAFGKSKDDGEERTAHSTQKPIECMAKPIKNNTAKGEGVYDPFLGSGTTLLACEMLDRKCYGIELDPAYCDIIVQRWQKYREKNGRSIRFKKNGIEQESLDGRNTTTKSTEKT